MTNIRRAAVRNDPNALETEPVYCYIGQQNDVAEFCRRTYLMSPLRAAFTVKQIEGERPTFIYVRNHLNPVPAQWWELLVERDARYVELAE